MKFRSLIQSKILKNITDRTELIPEMKRNQLDTNEISKKRLLFYLSEFIEGRYSPSKTEPSVCFEIEGDTVIAYMNYEYINKFELKRVVMTCELAHLLESGDITHLDIDELLCRHRSNMCDLSKSYKRLNERAIKKLGTVVSRFNFKEYEIVVKTDLYDENNVDPKYIDEYVTIIKLV